MIHIWNYIADKPIPVKRSVEITYAYINGVLNLTCEAIAEPQANFTWYRAGKRMTSKTHTFYSASHVSYLQVNHIYLTLCTSFYEP